MKGGNNDNLKRKRDILKMNDIIDVKWKQKGDNYAYRRN